MEHVKKIKKVKFSSPKSQYLVKLLRKMSVLNDKDQNLIEIRCRISYHMVRRGSLVNEFTLLNHEFQPFDLILLDKKSL